MSRPVKLFLQQPYRCVDGFEFVHFHRVPIPALSVPAIHRVSMASGAKSNRDKPKPLIWLVHLYRLCSTNHAWQFFDSFDVPAFCCVRRVFVLALHALPPSKLRTPKALSTLPSSALNSCDRLHQLRGHLELG